MGEPCMRSFYRHRQVDECDDRAWRIWDIGGVITFGLLTGCMTEDWINKRGLDNVEEKKVRKRNGRLGRSLTVLHDQPYGLVSHPSHLDDVEP